MADAIPMKVVGRPPDIEIEAGLVAPGLELGLEEFRELMSQGRIGVLCERGTGEDSGLYRASFYHGGRRVRLVVDRSGHPVAAATPGEQPPGVGGKAPAGRARRAQRGAGVSPAPSDAPDARPGSVKSDQAEMNSAAINGPITKPLMPKSTMPPSVEIRTT